MRSYVIWRATFAVLLFALLFQVFLPYGQVGVGIPGGLEGAIHISRHFISTHGADDSSFVESGHKECL